MLAFAFVPISHRFGKFWERNQEKLHGQSGRVHQK